MLNLVSAGYKCFHDKNELQFINSIGHKRFNVSFLRYNAERRKHHARKSKPQCKKIKNTVQEISKHSARDAE